jgi:hypothetical protein
VPALVLALQTQTVYAQEGDDGTTTTHCCEDRVFTRNVFFEYPVESSNPTDSTSSTTGALKIAGGVGIKKKLVVGGTTNLQKKLTLSAGGAEIAAGGLTITAGV